jgi:hypothetical protein
MGPQEWLIATFTGCLFAYCIKKFFEFKDLPPGEIHDYMISLT